ncbi:MAG: hypothetical protein HZB31_13075 [Nitrospirae bacterium]|nr:hypothetical protein [Nitrospirota bacterium]
MASVGYAGFRFLRNIISRPIFEIKLSPVDEPKWSDRRKITDLAASFHQKGFESAGEYTCPEIPSLIISGFVRPSEQMAGVIYDHPVQGIWVDLFAHYKDGGSLTVSSAPIGDELDHMPQQTKIYCKGSSFDDLFRRMLAENRETGRIVIPIAEFASRFEAQYQKEMKWRMDRGGPTYLEVRRVAEAMGVSTDREQLESKTRQIQQIWRQEQRTPPGTRPAKSPAALPGEFQRPEEFRRKMEQNSGPVPSLSVPAMPVYLVLFSAMTYWCYYGLQYSRTNAPVSLSAVLVFFGVFLVPFLITLVFRDFNRRVKMYPVLKRMAGMNPGAFLVVEGVSPSLYYAREAWIGKVSFEEGGETENAFTRLDATIRGPLNPLEIRRKNILDKISGRPDKDIIPMPESEFSRKFVVSGSDVEFAKTLLNPSVVDAIMRIAKIGNVVVDINRSTVRVEVENDLSRPRKEEALRQFLTDADTIIEKAANADQAAGR